MKKLRGITVVGGGYVGTVVAAGFAACGHTVKALEVDPLRLSTLRSGQVPFYEPGLEELVRQGLASGKLWFTDDPHDAVAGTDLVFFCVGTPPGPDGHPDLSDIEKAAVAIAQALRDYHVLVTKSTVPIGSGTWLRTQVEDALNGNGTPDELFAVASNPEFLREGSAVEDFLHPDRVVVGSDDSDALDVLVAAYQPILDQDIPGRGAQSRPPLLRTDLATAETIKYAANAFLATKVSFINEISHICEFVGADVSKVAEGMGLDNRIGGSFLGAGIGWGGSCFGKDIAALSATAHDYGFEPQILEAVVAVNRRQRRLVIDKLQQHLKTLRGRRVALLGLSFKPGTDDLRDAPSLEIARELLSRDVAVAGYDPVVTATTGIDIRLAADPYAAVAGADAVVVVTEWPEFRDLDLSRVAGAMRGSLLLDGRNMLDPDRVLEAGLRYDGIGRAPRRELLHID